MWVVLGLTVGWWTITLTNYQIIHGDEHCVVVRSTDPRESGLAKPLTIIESLWCKPCQQANEVSRYDRGDHYGKRVFYVYYAGQQIVEFLFQDLAAQNNFSRNPEHCKHPLIVDEGIVVTPLKDVHEILEYVLFDLLVGKDSE